MRLTLPLAIPTGIPSAHGIGGPRDLPVPLNLTVAAAIAALVVSFGVLALAWRTPRYGVRERGRPAPAWLDRLVASTGWTVLARGLGLLVFAYTAFVAVAGENRPTNPIFGIFFVLLWVGIVPASFLLGPVFRAISPVRTLNAAFTRLTGGAPGEGVFTYPERLGLWPAALGLFAFVWFELVYPFNTDLAPVRLWLAVYLAVTFVGGALFGERFFACCDPFEVYSSLVAKLSPWAMREDPDDPDAEPRLYLVSPLAHLDTVAPQPGLLAVIVVLFGSTGFDSFKDSSRWIGFVQGTTINGRLLDNLGLLAFIALAGLAFGLTTMLTGIDTGIDTGTGTGSSPGGLVGAVRARAHLPVAFAHSILPIVLGYVVAHYLSFAVDIGSVTIRQLSDPLTDGSDLLGTAHLPEFTYWSYHPTALAVVKVLAVVVGHIVAAVASHDRALRLLPRRHQLTGQLPLLAAMVTYTFVGLYLLFAS